VGLIDKTILSNSSRLSAGTKPCSIFVNSPAPFLVASPPTKKTNPKTY